jgi:hypothetical protein
VAGNIVAGAAADQMILGNTKPVSDRVQTSLYIKIAVELTMEVYMMQIMEDDSFLLGCLADVDLIS